MLCYSRTCNSDRSVDRRQLRVKARAWAEGYQLPPGRGQQWGLAHLVGVDAAPVPQRVSQMHPSTRLARMVDMAVRRRLSPRHRCLSVHLGRISCESLAQVASLVGSGLDWAPALEYDGSDTSCVGGSDGFRYNSQRNLARTLGRRQARKVLYEPQGPSSQEAADDSIPADGSSD